MKNLKVYKKALAVLTAGTLVLFSGCSVNQNTNTKETTTTQSDYCTHLTIYFEDTPITFKECEGYKIDYSIRLDGGLIKYSISKNKTDIISEGRTSKFNKYLINHDADELIKEESVQKTK